MDDCCFYAPLSAPVERYGKWANQLAAIKPFICLKPSNEVQHHVGGVELASLFNTLNAAPNTLMLGVLDVLACRTTMHWETMRIVTYIIA